MCILAVCAHAGANDVHLVAAARSAEDPKFGVTYRAACRVEIEENGERIHRFTVHTPDSGGSAEAQRAGRFLGELWRAANRRFGTLASGLRRTPVDVWLTRTGDAGGEQFRANLYIYDYTATRTGVEWARELAHEYGHYLLPGASGYTSPENWSNGVLGERLFLKWLRDDLQAGIAKADETPYVTARDLDDFCAKQSIPLAERIALNGPDRAALARMDKKGMEAFSALMLYVDSVYGSAMLMNMLDYLPPTGAAGARGLDFLAAFEKAVSALTAGELRVADEGPQMVFLPAGSVEMKADGGQRMSASVAGKTITAAGDGWLRLRRASPGWLPLTVAGIQKPVRISWKRVNP